MKKNLFIAAFALSAVLSACQVKENIEVPAPGPRMIEVKAVMDEGELPTKTILPEGTTHFFWSEEDKIAAFEKAKAIEAKLRDMKLIKAADKVRDNINETLTYMNFPEEHWQRIRTNNTLERLTIKSQAPKCKKL